MLVAWNAVFLDSEFFIVHYHRGLVGWLLIGLIAGWLAGKIARGRGFGCITAIVLGQIGSFLGGWIFMILGIFGGGFLCSVAAATRRDLVRVTSVLSVGSTETYDIAC